MSAVELLREAAKTMRDRASVATEGPWYPDWDSGVYVMPDMDPDWVISGGNVTYDDTQHIASWHPAVALAVADWLDATADEDGSEFAEDCCGEGDACFACATAKSALAVARAYLNRGQS